MKQPICGTAGSAWARASSRSFTPTCPAWTTSTATTTTAAARAAGRSCQGMTFNYESALTKPEYILKLSQERVLGMPYSISEWANVLPNQWRLEAPPLMAFYGNCLNGWDVPHALRHRRRRRRIHAIPQVDVAGQRALAPLCQYPALSQVIRRGDVKEGPMVFARNLSEAKVFSGGQSEGRGDQDRHLRALRDVQPSRASTPARLAALLCGRRRQDRRAVHQGRAEPTSPST